MILDLLFFALIAIVLSPVAIGIMGIFYAVKILFYMIFKGVSVTCACPCRWIVYHRRRH